jgi:hypothetical protein
MDSKPFVTGCLKINSSLQLNRYGAFLVLGVKRPVVKLTTQFHLLQRLRMSGAMLLIPLCFYDVKTDDVSCDFKTKYVFLYLTVKIKYQLSHEGGIINAWNDCVGNLKFMNPCIVIQL